MMDNRTGELKMLATEDPAEALAELDRLARAERDHTVLVHGTEAQLADLSRAVRLGNREIRRRDERHQRQNQRRT